MNNNNSKNGWSQEHCVDSSIYNRIQFFPNIRYFVKTDVGQSPEIRFSVSVTHHFRNPFKEAMRNLINSYFVLGKDIYIYIYIYMYYY